MILGLTGAIGSGKSTALAMFARLGARTNDADRICHRFYEEKNPALIDPLRQRWGERIFAADGSVRVKGRMTVSLDAHRVERPSLLTIKIEDACVVDLDLLLRRAG